MMQYFSTRGHNEPITASNAILKGLASDGGLFVPSVIPQLDSMRIEQMAYLSYQEIAQIILGYYLNDFSPEQIKDCIDKAYNTTKFDHRDIAPVASLDDKKHVLELWHGPTSAFKDMALQILPQLIEKSLKINQHTGELLILVATSGDTGKAALEGFQDVPQTKIMVFYPDKGVSKIQWRQMVTQEGANLAVIGVNGNFDDAQTGVKAIFKDEEYASQLMEQSIQLSSANSINWGRLLPQIVYYFSTYANLVARGQILAGDKVNFAVPTGNFGDILAGYYAKEMGLPIDKLICASNSNNVLTDFLETGTYNRERPFHKTISPSMDILISSNLERLLYHITKDSTKVAAWMQELQTTGSYTVDSITLAKIKETFVAGYVDDERTQEAITDVYAKYHYVLDPHTAVAWHVCEDTIFQEENHLPTIVLATASPYKFNEAVLEALGVDKTIIKNSDEFSLLDKLFEYNDEPVPKNLDKLRTAPILHDEICNKNNLKSAIDTFIGH